MNYGIQMYSLRDVTKVDLREALRLVSEMGYRGVEFAGFFGNSAEDVKAWLKEYRLEAIGTHSGIDMLLPENIDETVKYHLDIGCYNLIVPCANWETEESMNRNIEILNNALPILNAAGISLGYHNHSSEFFETPYGKVVFDEIISATSVMLEIDTFWLYNAGIDPISYLDAHKDRIKIIHLKDGNVDKNIEKDFKNSHAGAVGLSVGKGELPITDIVQWAKDNDVKIVVESEGLDPTGPLEVERCIEFLKTI